MEQHEQKQIVIQGIAGAFHEIAARRYFQNETIDIIPATTFEELVDIVEQKERACLGIMAIENSIAGSLQHNYTLINNATLKITGEIRLRIKQNLLALPGTLIEQLEEVHSHYMAIAQCKEFFKSYPSIKLVETDDTAASAQHISKNKLSNVGAIASDLAGELYGLENIFSGIETNKKNYTRFFILEREASQQHNGDFNKVSISFTVKHEVGGLFAVLSVMNDIKANLTKIESRPLAGRPWEYLFFVDFKLSTHNSFTDLIKNLSSVCDKLKILGTYKAGNHYEH